MVPPPFLSAAVCLRGVSPPLRAGKPGSTGLPKIRAIFSASTVEGTKRPASMAFTVWRLTPMASANCCWVMRTSARSTRILFFIAERFVKPVHGHAEKQVVDGRDGVQQYEHAGQELEVVETQCQQDQ